MPVMWMGLHVGREKQWRGPPARGLDKGKMSGLKDIHILQVSTCSSDKITISTLRVSKKAGHTGNWIYCNLPPPPRLTVGPIVLNL